MRRFLLSVWRSLRAEIVFGFLIGSVFWAAILGWQAANAPTDAEKQECYEAARHAGHKSEECKSLWEKTTSDPVAFFTLVLAISTIGFWVATIFLYRAGERQFRHARRSSASQARDMQASITAAQRAAEASMISAQSSKGAIRGVIAIKNFQGGWNENNGRIEGYGVSGNIENVGNSHVTCSIFAAARIIDPAIEDFIFDAAPVDKSSGLISPGTKAVPQSPLGLTVDDAVRVWMGEARFLYYCRVNYLDIFAEPHHTECCMSVGFRGDPRAPQVGNNEFITYTSYGPQNTAS
ncbi:hypothetical protein ABIA99_001105 [Bradyrhizobium sp. LB12.1]|uniref:hypothetical protein n=1 Tax=Bradyrhizobium sp. LB12.1 TaxID=3156327 RepID=UPI00339316B6